jgi:hypothetical protein
MQSQRKSRFALRRCKIAWRDRKVTGAFYLTDKGHLSDQAGSHQKRRFNKMLVRCALAMKFCCTCSTHLQHYAKAPNHMVAEMNQSAWRVCPNDEAWVLSP